eukprot:CAMPEP_0198595212 /NCGR_PEP_ID=MMETSP1462-20131121/141615_1 /TAXON_ID=1333877 /ORGANISM="Brandtodinium nutriculum, Strain RCC3387" /LENGTH=135 /DNA_ID=CAMNT_0044326841 /DNA_START=113 /DNA_END=516 /DNA_ORIENTATION=+
MRRRPHSRFSRANALGSHFTVAMLRERLGQQGLQMPLEELPPPAEGRVRTVDVHLDPRLVCEIASARQEPRLPMSKIVVAIKPRRQGHSLLVQHAVRLGRVSQLVHKVPPHEDLEDVALLAAGARQPAESLDVEA